MRERDWEAAEACPQEVWVLEDLGIWTFLTHSIHKLDLRACQSSFELHRGHAGYIRLLYRNGRVA